MDIRKFENREEALSTVDLINPNISVIQDEDTILVGVKNLEENASLVISEVGSDKTLSLFPSIMIKYKSNIQLKNPPNTLDSKTLVVHTYNEETGIGFLIYNGTITKIDEGAFSEENKPASRLLEITIPDSVTTIEKNAFYYCEYLEDIKISDSIESIGECAFNCCYKLKTINLGNKITTINNETFQDCRTLNNITIPDSVTSIGEGSFHCCTGLTSIIIPESVITIGNSAFDFCLKLESLIIGNNVTSIGNYAFRDCILSSVIIPENVETLGRHAFYNCNPDLEVTINSQKLLSKTYTTESNLTNCIDAISIIIGDNVESLGNYIFYYSPKSENNHLTKITIGTNVDIDTENQVIFNNEDSYNYNTLETVIIKSTKLLTKDYKEPSKTKDYGLKKIFGKRIKTYDIKNDTITSIGNYCFSECDTPEEEFGDTEEIILPDNIISLGIGTFKTSRIINMKTLPNSLENIGNYCFQSSGIGIRDGLTIPENVTIIGIGAFDHCEFKQVIFNTTKISKISEEAFSYNEYLTTIKLPDSIISIDNSAFIGCGFTEFNLKNVQTIGEWAFYGSKLKTITIPNTVTSIGDYAFDLCGSLTHIIWDAPNCNIYEFKSDAEDRKRITIFEFGEHMITIPEKICNGMDGLKEITIPATTTSILGNNEKYAFSGCNSLETVNWNAKECESRCPGAGENVSEFTVNLGDEVMTLPECFCSENTKLKNITLSNNVGTISKLAFFGCTNLQTINFNEKLLTIGESAFSGCTSLGDIEFKHNIKTIGNRAFYNCTNLNFNYLPNNLWEIYDYAFQNCSSINGILTIVSNINSIGAYAFSGCTSISKVYFGTNRNITKLKEGIFSECTNLIEVSMSTNIPLTTIEKYAFSHCKSLYSIGTLPNTLTYLDEYALQYCSEGQFRRPLVYYNGSLKEFRDKLWPLKSRPYNSTAHVHTSKDGSWYDIKLVYYKK